MPLSDIDTSLNNTSSRPLRKRRTNTADGGSINIGRKRPHLLDPEDQTNGHESLNLIERTNALSLETLYERFLLPTDELIFDIEERRFEVELTTAGVISKDEFKACFRMLERNMKEGWVKMHLCVCFFFVKSCLSLCLRVNPFL